MLSATISPTEPSKHRFFFNWFISQIDPCLQGRKISILRLIHNFFYKSHYTEQLNLKYKSRSTRYAGLADTPVTLFGRYIQLPLVAYMHLL